MKKRILLMDDELFIINSLSRILSVMDIIIDSSTSPTHALDLVKEINYDIIISDPYVSS